MMRFVLWWGHDSSLAIKMWQLFCFGNTTVFWLSNDGSCFVVGIRRKLAIKLWQLLCGEDKTVVWLSNDGSCFVLGIRQ